MYEYIIPCTRKKKYRQPVSVTSRMS
jgi:hypothetical protein